MQLTDYVCPHCGAALKVDPENRQASCEHCGATLFVDDEKQHVEVDNAEQAGYDFERGRQRAQAEQAQKKTDGSRGASAKKLFTTRNIVYLAVLIALEIVLNRFLSINTPVVKIGFAFVPIAIAGMIFGPIPAAIVAALADLLGAILFPNGTIFLGITLTAFLKGISWGLFLHKKQTVATVVPAVLVDQLVLSYVLNSFWLSILMGTPYTALLATRIVQTAILIPVEFVVVFVLSRAIGKFGKRLFA